MTLTAQQWEDLNAKWEGFNTKCDDLATKLEKAGLDLAEVKTSVATSSHKIDDLRKFQDKAEAPVHHVKAFVSSIAVLAVITIGGIVSGIVSMASLNTAVAALATKEQVAKLDTTVGHHGKDLARLEARINALKGQLAVLIPADAHPFQGKISRVDKDNRFTVVIGMGVEKTFKLDKTTPQMYLDGKLMKSWKGDEAKYLDKGAVVTVFTANDDDQKVTAVHIWTKKSKSPWDD